MVGHNELLMSSSVLIFGCCMAEVCYLIVKYGNAEGSPLSPLQFDSIPVSTWDIVIVFLPNMLTLFIFYLVAYGKEKNSSQFSHLI